MPHDQLAQFLQLLANQRLAMASLQDAFGHAIEMADSNPNEALAWMQHINNVLHDAVNAAHNPSQL